jgi:EAL domain-containing protein (putative c-di-GMP-specific phosphodiesterase class I)
MPASPPPLRATVSPSLQLAFQPVIDLHDGRIEYLETYLRLPTPGHRAQLLAAEEDGSIVDLDMAVLALALPLLRRGHRLALNVSPRTVLSRRDDFTGPLLALPEEARPIIEINDPYLLEDHEQQRLAALLQGLPIGLNHYQGSALENEVLAIFKPTWVKLDGAPLDSCFSELGCNALQQALSICGKLNINLVITRIETAEQLAHVRHLCGARWGQGNFLAAAGASPDYPPYLSLPTVPEHNAVCSQPKAEACWHCLYSRLSEQPVTLLAI